MTARKKLVLTKQSIAPSQSVRRQFTASFDATGLDHADVARALRALADAVEGARIDAKADALRAAVVSRDATLATVTRLPVPTDGPYPVALNGDALGSADFVTVQPPTPRAASQRPRSRYLFSERSEEDDFQTWQAWEDAGTRDVVPEPEEDDDEDDGYYEDDHVEFWHHDQWRPGIVVDKASPYTYLVEDQQRRQWEVHVQCIRKPKE
jgi:hypothetical protein